MRPFGSPESLERRRHLAIELLEKGRMPGEVAHKLGVDRRSVHRWQAAHRSEGRAGLAAKAASGRPPKLDERKRELLEEYLLRGAKSFGFPSDLWTCPRVADVIWRRFRVEYHVDHIGRLLRSMGWSPQRPERRARERDEKVIRGWIKKVWPRVKKTRAD